MKFNQLENDYTIFEYGCPSGLVFDERWEVCVWPSQAAPCDGSSEIRPIPQSPYVCPGEGYFQDPENCRWFYACMDHRGDGTLTHYEFRCPFGLAFDEAKLICDWPWLVPGCEGTPGYARPGPDLGRGGRLLSDRHHPKGAGARGTGIAKPVNSIVDRPSVGLPVQPVGPRFPVGGGAFDSANPARQPLRPVAPARRPSFTTARPQPTTPAPQPAFQSTRAPFRRPVVASTTAAPFGRPAFASTTAAPFRRPAFASTTAAAAPSRRPAFASTTAAAAPSRRPAFASTTAAPFRRPAFASTTAAPFRRPAVASTTAAPFGGFGSFEVGVGVSECDDCESPLLTINGNGFGNGNGIQVGGGSLRGGKSGFPSSTAAPVPGISHNSMHLMTPLKSVFSFSMCTICIVS